MGRSAAVLVKFIVNSEHVWRKELQRCDNDTSHVRAVCVTATSAASVASAAQDAANVTG